MKNKKIFIVALLLLLVGTTFVSCQKERSFVSGGEASATLELQSTVRILSIDGEKVKGLGITTAQVPVGVHNYVISVEEANKPKSIFGWIIHVVKYFTIGDVVSYSTTFTVKMDLKEGKTYSLKSELLDSQEGKNKKSIRLLGPTLVQ